MIHRLWGLSFAVLLVLLAAGTARAAVTPLGEISRVDEAPSCMDSIPNVAPLADGGFVAVWMASVGDQPTGSSQLLGRFLDGGGRPRGPAFRLDEGDALLWLSDLATDVDGNFMMVGREQGTNDVAGRVFSPSGAPLTANFVITPSVEYIHDVQLFAEWDGGFTVVWMTGLATGTTIQRRRYTAGGEPLGPAETLTGAPSNLSYATAAHGDDGTAAVWMESENRIRAGIFRPGSAPVLFPVHAYTQAAVSQFSFDPPFFAVASLPDGISLVAWRDVVAAKPAVFVRAFDAAGQPLGPAGRADNPAVPDPFYLAGLEATVDSSGDFVVAWQGGPRENRYRSLHVRVFGPDGAPQGSAVEAGSTAGNPNDPALAGSRNGSPSLLVWADGEYPDTYITPVPSCYSEGIYARPVFTACARGESLCLQDGRFQVRVAWTHPNGQTGNGQAVPLTRESGTFWFFGANNVELAVKILDGRTENGHFWVFYGSLSDVGYTITIDDTVTGATRTYVNPHSTLASRSDTTAFPAAPVEDGIAAASAPSHLPPSDGPGPCSGPFVPDLRRPGLCLNGNRFEVEVAWHDPFHGTSGIAKGVRLTQDSGYFWFFGRDNLELVVKVLDGRTYNGKFWVFYGALTNVEYTVRVRHVESGAERIYHNPPFEFRSRSDIDAFSIAE
jgi:hypothetical protein